MKTYTYSGLDHFEQAMNNPEHLANMSVTVMAAVAAAVENQKKIADVCDIVLNSETSTNSYRIRLPKAEWAGALLTSMKHMEAVGYVDEVIDAYVLHRQLTQPIAQTN